MINNSNWYRWNRLAAKSLDQQFINEIIHGLNCSPFEAEAVLESVYHVFGDFFDSSESLKPGQIRLPVVSIEAQNNQRLSDAKQVTVTLTLTESTTKHCAVFLVLIILRVFNRRIDGGFNWPYLMIRREGMIVGHRALQPEASRLSSLSKGKCAALPSAIVFGRKQKTSNFGNPSRPISLFSIPKRSI